MLPHRSGSQETSKGRLNDECVDEVAAGTVVVPWNDPAAFVAATEQHALAAILAEPLPANMGLVPPQPGFLELLRERADATGALLVLEAGRALVDEAGYLLGTVLATKRLADGCRATVVDLKPRWSRSAR